MKLNEIWLPGTFPTTIEEVRTALDKHGISSYKYHINSDLTVDVGSDVNLNSMGLTRLPVKFGHIDGMFQCDRNFLKSLEGAPREVNDFYCQFNSLKSLEGAPSIVHRDFNCFGNKIESLEGIAAIIKHTKSFLMQNNPIKSGGVGLLLIDGLVKMTTTKLLPGYKPGPFDIISTYLGKPELIFECQEELSDAGFEEYAKP